ncbi:MAG TPA: hypothetical protein VD978_01055 [Azospirillum sp.]|nr:hypothetical protein [Azospirillum sp.]
MSRVPALLTGLWRRLSIEHADGRIDATTTVLWLQTRTLYADIRIPTGRPSGAFADLTDEGLLRCAAQEGFAGTIALDGDVCTWHRALDVQPPGAPPDAGRLTLQGSLLVEYGVHVPYTEHWWRQDDGGGRLAAFRLERDAAGLARTGVLVLVGDHFLEAVSRPFALPEAPSLAALVAPELDAGRRDVAERLLDVSLCYGRIAARGTPWRVEHATLPWLEGRRLFERAPPSFDPDTGVLVRPSDDGREVWRLDDSTIPGADLARLFTLEEPR